MRMQSNQTKLHFSLQLSNSVPSRYGISYNGNIREIETDNPEINLQRGNKVRYVGK